jgi:hypothetical protein
VDEILRNVLTAAGSVGILAACAYSVVTLLRGDNRLAALVSSLQAELIRKNAEIEHLTLLLEREREGE